MKRPIVMTKEIIQKMTEEFATVLSKQKLLDGKVDYQKTLYYPSDDKDQKAQVLFTPVAYLKMLRLLGDFSTEVAWHGVVERQGEQVFLIKDILVYPQEVTGATVNTDQEAYQRWMMNLGDETYNALRVQMHSHVNMAVTPSSVDLHHQEEIINQLSKDDYYIFMIWNKRLEHTVKIYDMTRNVMYDGDSVIVSVQTEGENMDEFADAAKEMVKTKAWTGTYNADAGKPDKKGGKKSTTGAPYGQTQWNDKDWYKHYTEGEEEDDDIYPRKLYGGGVR